MIFKPSRSIGQPSLILLILTSLMLAACGREEDTVLPEGCDGVTWGSGVEVEERAGDFYAIVQGDYPDSCSTLCGTEQEVEGSDIKLNLYSDRPEGILCSQMLTPFETEVLLDTEGLDPGEVTVRVNVDHAMTTFTFP